MPAVGGAGEIEWDADTVVLLCVKGHQTAAALDDLAAHAPTATVVVSAQNGIANEPAILRLFEATYGICVMLPATHLEPGVVVQKCHPTPGILDLGRVPEGVDATAEAIAADLRGAGFESVPRPDIMAWKRRKLLMNLGNAVDAACAPGDAATELEERARAEGEQVYAAAGLACVSSAEDRERRGDILRRRDDLHVPLGGSTFQSLSRGTATEVDQLNGEIVLLGRLHGVPTPANALLQETCRVLARDGAAPAERGRRRPARPTGLEPTGGRPPVPVRSQSVDVAQQRGRRDGMPARVAVDQVAREDRRVLRERVPPVVGDHAARDLPGHLVHHLVEHAELRSHLPPDLLGQQPGAARCRRAR